MKLEDRLLNFTTLTLTLFWGPFQEIVFLNRPKKLQKIVLTHWCWVTTESRFLLHDVNTVTALRLTLQSMILLSLTPRCRWHCGVDSVMSTTAPSFCTWSQSLHHMSESHTQLFHLAESLQHSQLHLKKISSSPRADPTSCGGPGSKSPCPH